MKKKYAFISYSTVNLEEAEIVREVLSGKGILCWMAPNSIPFGSNYSTEIFDAISDCFVFVLLLSKESMNSDFVSKELDLAVSNHKYILPVKIDSEPQTSAFRFYLCNVQVIPIDNSLRQTAEKLASFILSRSSEEHGTGIRLVQKYEKPATGLLSDRVAIECLDRLFETNNVVCISGMGGMGKSAFAKIYIKALMEQNRLDAVSYNACPGSIRQAISMIPFEGIEDEEMIEEGMEAKTSEDVETILYQKKLSLLKKLSKGTVLVFDGLNQLDYEGMEELDRLQCKVLITTRLHFEEYPELRIEDIMTFEKQKELFLQFYEDFSGSEDDLRYIEKIIRAVGNHVLTIKLIALYLNTTGMSPEELYGKLFSKGTLILNTSEKVSYKHNYQTVDEHISELFQLSDLSPEELQVLQQLSYVPSFGIPKRQFRLWTPPGTMVFVDQLIKKGWIQNNKGIIGLHPIIHSVMKKKRPARPEALSGFFSSVITYLDMNTLDTIAQRQSAALLSEYLADENFEPGLLACNLYLALGRYLNDYTYWLLFGARNMYHYTSFIQVQNKDARYLDQFSTARACLEKGVAICEAAEIGNENGIRARLYSNLGATCFNMRDFQTAAACHQIALELRTEELGEGHPETRTSRRRLGSSLLETGDCQAAFRCYYRNLELLIASREDPVKISKAYFDCGKALAYQNDLEQALVYLKKAIRELEKADPATVDSLGAAQLYYKTACIMADLGQNGGAADAQKLRALLLKAEACTDALDSAASDELKQLIRELLHSI